MTLRARSKWESDPISAGWSGQGWSSELGLVPSRSVQAAGISDRVPSGNSKVS